MQNAVMSAAVVMTVLGSLVLALGLEWLLVYGIFRLMAAGARLAPRMAQAASAPLAALHTGPRSGQM